ncbi:YfhO family protein [soil metagenome]
MASTFDFRRDVLPHVLAVFFFLLLTVAYFSPIFFEGKTLAQNDVLQFRGGAKEILDYRERTGEEALWTNSMFSGMPAYLISVQFTGDMFRYVHQLFTLGLPPIALNIFLTLVCAYVLFAAMGMSAWLAVIGAIAMAFTSYNFIILEAGHNTKSIAIAYAPLVLAGLIYTYRRNLWLGAALFSLGLALHIRANHIQITYYLLLMILIFGLIELVYALRQKALAPFLQRTAVLVLGAVLAVGVSFGRLYTTATYGNYSIRGGTELRTGEEAGTATGVTTGLTQDYAFNWSYGVLESLTLLIPDFYGGGSSVRLTPGTETYQRFAQMGVPASQLRDMKIPFYWGDQPSTSGPVYVGAIICFLFVLGLLVADNRLRMWLLLATVLSLLLAWGKNFGWFNYLVFDYFPGYNKFRAVSMTLVIAQLAMPLLALVALFQFLRAADGKALRQKLFYAAGITGGICLLVALFAGAASFVGALDERLAQAQSPVEAIRADRESMMRGDAFRSLLFILLAAGLMFLYLRKTVSATVVVAGIGLLVLVDLWTVNKRYLGNDDFQRRVVENFFQPTPVDQAILRDPDLHYRVINMGDPFNDARTSYFHKSVGGYHGAKLRRYQDVIERHLSRGNVQVFNMLNTRYIITGQEQQPVQRNPDALGNAWFVQTVKPVNTPDEEIAALTGFNAATEAVVDVRKFPVAQTQYPSEGSSIRLTAYQPNALTYEATAAQDVLVVFSEIYYPEGWNAYLNEQPVEHIRANYLLRAMTVPAGTHAIEFRFEPKEYAIGNTVSLVSSVLLLLALVGAAISSSGVFTGFTVCTNQALPRASGLRCTGCCSWPVMM